MRAIERRRAYGGKVLPYDAEVEYLEIRNIDQIAGFSLRFPPSENLGFKLKIEPKSQGQNQSCFGTYDSWNKKFFIYTTANKIEFHINSTSFTTAISPGPVTVLWNWMKSGKFEVYQDGNLIKQFTMPSLSFTSSRSIGLFYATNQQYPYGRYVGRIYEFQVSKEEEIVTENIFVRIDNEGCMFDKLNDRLYRNVFTASNSHFILGPDVISGG